MTFDTNDTSLGLRRCSSIWLAMSLPLLCSCCSPARTQAV